MKKIGGKTFKENVKNVMEKMMDVNVMTKFNMKGVNRKTEFKKQRFDNTRLCRAIIGGYFGSVSLLEYYFLLHAVNVKGILGFETMSLLLVTNSEFNKVWVLFVQTILSELISFGYF